MASPADGPRRAPETEELPRRPPTAPAGVVREPLTIGPYRIVRVLGRGGMGTVYRGEVVGPCNVPLGREVAIKVLRRVDAEERRRFKREVAYLQVLRHPGIVRVLDHGEHHGRPYLVMPLVEGRMLDDLVDESRKNGRIGIDQRKAAEVILQALEALHVAHLAGILHRDLKPGNIIIANDGAVKLLDFGLAMSLDRESGLTRSNAVVGTPAYMSPEQAQGTRADLSRRSDIYAIGTCLYELLTGRQPFTAGNSMALLKKIIEDPLVPPRRLRADLDPGLDGIVRMALAKEPQDRYPTAEAMATDLRRWLRGEKVKARGPAMSVVFWRALRRERRSLAAAGLVVFILGAVLALAVKIATRGGGGNGGLVDPAGEPASTEWIVTWRAATLPVAAPGAKPGPKDLPALRPTALKGLGKGALVAVLPPVPGAVRLTISMAPLIENGQLELLLSDRDLGKGYRLRMATGEGGDRMHLFRESQLVASVNIGRLHRGRPLRLRFTRDEDHLLAELSDARSPAIGGAAVGGGSATGANTAASATAAVVAEANRTAAEPVIWRTVLRFDDLVPIEGGDASGNAIALAPNEFSVADLSLERRRAALTASPLATADTLRQDGKFARALALYEQFLADRPDAPEVRDARLRAAICLESLEDFENALSRFAAIAEGSAAGSAGAATAGSATTPAAPAPVEDPRYILVATFHAWSCALRLGRHDEADTFFARVRAGYPLPSLLATVPESLIADLVKDHLVRAEKAIPVDAERAASLARTGADLADHLGQATGIQRGRMLAGDLLVGLERFDAALIEYRSAAYDQRLPAAARMQAVLSIGHVERLRGNAMAAAESYRVVATNPTGGEERAQWARLWMGDLRLGEGDLAAATDAWDDVPETTSLPGRIMQHLLHGEPPIPPPANREGLNKVEYFTARLYLLRADEARYREGLASTVRMGPPSEFPVPLARKLIAELPEP
ncbi:hypothetical protein LBMAG53_19600 [Planctomycetota bacterium]|nr:hypothetical protein LBMAG53_19600 [Planctomycetota bacterium]